MIDHERRGPLGSAPPGARGDATRPVDPLQLAVAHHRSGRIKQAKALYQLLLDRDPGHFTALCLLGAAESDLRNFEAAVALFRRALAIDPNCAEAHSHLGSALVAVRRFDAAIASFDCALALEPENPRAWNNRGNALFALARYEEARASYERTLALRADSAEVLFNLGNACLELRRPDEALASFDRALAQNTDYVEAFNNRGSALCLLARHEDALKDFDRALSLRPGYLAALKNRACVLRDLRRPAEALAQYDAAFGAQPQDAAVLCDRGNALLDLGRVEEALESYANALGMNPQLTEPRYNRGVALAGLGRHAEAADEFARVIETQPDFAFARGELLHSRLHSCDWRGYSASIRGIVEATGRGLPASTPFAFLSASGEHREQLACAIIYGRHKIPAPLTALCARERYSHEKFRIAYLSADFHDHATAHLATELFERHDATRFETYALSFGPARGDKVRARLERAFSRFIDVRNRSDRETAHLIRQLEIDVAVDLKGYTRDSRPRILAHRPAPVQVSYLGYPGSMGVDFIDYVIADRFVITESEAAFYTEKIAWLPRCYQPNDSQRPIAATSVSRAEAGLPDPGFVFCSFGAAYKIAAPVFDCWMRLLTHVPGSVLWLLKCSESAAGNLRQAARDRGVNPARLVFAPRVRLEEHLARHRLADLFLDTLPVNAHTTASDALWAGLPVVTQAGRAFAGRVAGSLLRAVGLPDLVTHTLAEYEALALDLARDPRRLAATRARLARNRLNDYLFDTDRLRRDIERAFAAMIDRSRRGDPPESFLVAPAD